jgi:hypothetical protein
LTTRFEDARNSISEHYYLNIEMNKAARRMYDAHLEPEPDARALQSRSMPRQIIEVEALNNPIILNIGFYFSKEKRPLAVVFCFSVSHKGYSRKGSIEREYVGDRTESAFDSYSAQYLQSARTSVMAAYDERALKSASIKNPNKIAVFVGKIFYQILEQWSHLK